MRRKRAVARRRGLPAKLLPGAVLLCGCADLAMEPDRIPTEMAVVPDLGRFGAGEPTELKIVVKDQHGAVMPVPDWAPPLWTEPDGSAAPVSPDGTLNAKNDGWLDVTARLAGLTADARFCITSGDAFLQAPVIYLNQAVPERQDTTLIAGRPALLRIFMTQGLPSDLEIAVRVTLLRDEAVVFEKLLSRKDIPTEVDQSDLAGSVNVEVPGSVIQPGVRMIVELDPECVAPLSGASRTRYPPHGSRGLGVVEAPPYRIVLVPTVQISWPDSSVFDWTDGMNPDSEQMRMSRTILPVGAMEVEVRETYTTGLNLRSWTTWSAWLRGISVLYEQEGRRGYYYGVVGVPGYGVQGLGRIGYPVSVGSGADHVHTHEIGHNMNLLHAPCGGAGGPDPSYPYAGGSIGVWGYDVAGKRLVNPGIYKDIMGYCFQRSWISDYHFDRALTHRLNGDGGINHGADADALRDSGRGEMLVVWGGVRDGRLTLDPAFVLDGPAVLPEADGPYRVEGLGAGGETRFSLSFSPTPLADGGGSFVFFVPYEPEWAGNLHRMVLTGPEGEYAITRDGESLMAVVTDRTTGRVRAIFRDWDGGPLPGEETAKVTVTRGVPAGGPR